jgi:hypothetical protein
MTCPISISAGWTAEVQISNYQAKAVRRRTNKNSRALQPGCLVSAEAED